MNAYMLAFQSDGAVMDKAYMGLNANTGALGACYTALVDANRGQFIGSKEFKNVKKGMEDLIAHRAELLNERDPERIALYERKLSEVSRHVTRYLLKKAEEARSSTPSALAKRRAAAVRALGAKLRIEASHIQDYREAEASRERYLNGMTQHEEFSARRKRDTMEVDRYLARGAARELFPKMASRSDPVLAQNGAKLKAEAEVVFAEAGQPETPELLERRVRLYAGLVADRMIEQRMQKKGDAAQPLLNARDKDPELFEKLRTAVMNSPGFIKEIGHEIDRNLTADTAQWDKTIRRMEKKMMPQPPAKQEAPKQQAPKNNAQPEKKASGPKK